jgi:hypothetical protein
MLASPPAVLYLLRVPKPKIAAVLENNKAEIVEKAR